MLRFLGILAAPVIVSSAFGQASNGDPAADEQEALLRIPGVRSLTLTGELRWRFESRLNYDFNDGAGANPSFVDQRTRIAFDLDIDDDLRAFLQLQDARTFGEESSSLDRSADGLDLHQGYLDWRNPLDDQSLLRVGRQEISLGDQRLVSSLNWATQARTFDGGLLNMELIDNVGLAAWFLITREDKLLNDHQGQYFFGVQASCDVPDSIVRGDVYIMGLIDEETPADSTANRWTAGTLIKAKEGDVDASFEGAYQFGEEDKLDIADASAIHAGGGYTLADLPWTPRVGVEYNMATGDDPATTARERFNTLFPFAHFYFGYMDFALWENISHFAVAVQATPKEKHKVKLAWHNFHADEPKDRFSGPTITLSPSGIGGAAHMGDEVDFTWRHAITGGLWGELGLSVFLPGDGVLDAKGFDDTAYFVYYMAGLKF
ncbi:MAG: alginate export family protein [Planctomycetota bacterium]